ncbi:MAG TPA: xanthine dehydrogenase family protein subunit M [Gemmatimonadaceae bacterium]|jgi:carbon-monoxide dehydrogenase medium subunit
MYPAPFEYHRASSVDEAIALLSRYGDDAKLLAGGHSLIPLLKLRFAQPAHLIDVRHIHALHGISEQDGRVLIGAATTHWMVESSQLLRDRIPVLADSAALIGDPQVRNMGTIGGSLAHSDPSADYPAVMLALDAEMVATGPKGSRTIAASEFFVGMLTSALTADEVLTAVRIPVPAAGTHSAYEKYPHPASRYAVVGVAATVTMSGGTVQRARLGVTGLGAHATRATAAEQAFAGSKGDAAAIHAAAARVSDGIDVRTDLQGGEDYKRALATAYARRALERAVQGR